MPTTRDIEKILENTMHPKQLLVEDQSHLHAGHAGWRPGGGTHFQITIVADAFAGKSRVERHRMVNQVLAPLFDQGLHALAIKAYSADELTG